MLLDRHDLEKRQPSIQSEQHPSHWLAPGITSFISLVANLPLCIRVARWPQSERKSNHRAHLRAANVLLE